MPVVACPKCPTQLKIPDGASGNVRCPKCGTVFPAAPKPAFEVVDDAPASKPATPSKASAPLPKAPVKAAADGDDFEVVKKKPKTNRRDEEEDDDDDDDDDDRPRSKKRKRRDEDDDDDDDDRPRRRKKRRRDYEDDDDDDDWRPQPRGQRGAFAKGKTGALLLSISFWLNAAAYGLLALYALIAWIMLIAATESSPSSRGRSSGGGGGDGSFMDVVVILPGLLGLGAWIVGLIGCAFAIAGPSKARGMAITATVFAALHLLLTGVTFSNTQDSLGFGRGVPGVGKIGWIFVATSLPALDAFLPLLFYQSGAMSGEYVIALMAGVCEVGRLVFALLALKGLAVAARDYEAGEKAQFGVMTASFVVGGVAFGCLLLVLLLAEAKMGAKSAAHLAMLSVLATFVAYACMMLSPALAAGQTKDACDRRS